MFNILCLFPLCKNKQVQCLVFHILFYGRVRRLLEKARRPFCNRVPDQLTSKKGSSCLADYPVIYQLSSCCLLSVSCDKLLPTNKCLISAALRRRGKKESDQGPSDEVFCDQPTNLPSHLYSPFWTLSPPYTPLQWWTQIHCER